MNGSSLAALAHAIQMDSGGPARRRYGLMGGAALTAVFFGMGHLTQLISGTPLMIVLMQVVMAIAIGWVFVGARLRTNSIWPVIIVHMLTDFVQFIKGSVIVQENTSADQIIVPIVSLVLFAFGYFVLRGAAKAAAVGTAAQKAG